MAERFTVCNESELISVVDYIYTYLFENRVIVQHLWKIDTPELHIYHDVEMLLRKHVYSYLTKKNIDVHMADYRSILYASTILTTIRWLLEDDHFEKKDTVINTLKDFLQSILK